MLLTILIFIVLLGLLVFVHELGHFLVAKRSGMVVHEFGFGFPPRLFGVQKHQGRWRIIWGNKEVSSEDTVYSVNAILLGGFVRIMGEDATEAADRRSFVNRPFWPRFLTLIAGVTMNFLLAAVLLGFGFMVGLPTVVTSSAEVPAGARFVPGNVTIVQVMPDSPAAQAGLMVGDKVLALDTTRVSDVATVQQLLQAKPRQIVIVSTVNSKGETNTQPITLAVDDTGHGRLGVGLGLAGTISYPWYAAIGQGFVTAGRGIEQIVVGLGSLFVSKEALSGVGGPVKIAQLTGQVAAEGFLPLLQFAAFLSLNLAVLNILPIPALDGGRILFLIIEKVRGRKNNQRLEQYANGIGFLVLLALMLIITLRDVWQLPSVQHLFS